MGAIFRPNFHCFLPLFFAVSAAPGAEGKLCLPGNKTLLDSQRPRSRCMSSRLRQSSPGLPSWDAAGFRQRRHCPAQADADGPAACTRDRDIALLARIPLPDGRARGQHERRQAYLRNGKASPWSRPSNSAFSQNTANFHERTFQRTTPTFDLPIRRYH